MTQTYLAKIADKVIDLEIVKLAEWSSADCYVIWLADASGQLTASFTDERAKLAESDLLLAINWKRQGI